MSALEFLHLAAGVALAAAAWLIRAYRRFASAAIAICCWTRRIGARRGFARLATAAAVCGLVVLALGAGFALADHR
jgi:hypothetical protein